MFGLQGYHSSAKVALSQAAIVQSRRDQIGSIDGLVALGTSFEPIASPVEFVLTEAKVASEKPIALATQSAAIHVASVEAMRTFARPTLVVAIVGVRFGDQLTALKILR